MLLYQGWDMAASRPYHSTVLGFRERRGNARSHGRMQLIALCRYTKLRGNPLRTPLVLGRSRPLNEDSFSGYTGNPVGVVVGPNILHPASSGEK